MAFPQTLDNFTNPTPSTPTNSPVTPLSGQLSQLNNAVEAIEAVIGVTGSTVPTSIEYRLADVQAVAANALPETSDGLATVASFIRAGGLINGATVTNPKIIANSVDSIPDATADNTVLITAAASQGSRIGVQSKPAGAAGSNSDPAAATDSERGLPWSNDSSYPNNGIAHVSVIVGGYDHVCNQEAGTLLGGGHNFLQYNASGHGSIVGGSNHRNAGARGVIAGGLNNTIGASSTYGAIVGGSGCLVDSSWSASLGGENSIVSSAAQASAAIGGRGNSIRAYYSAILAAQNGTVQTGHGYAVVWGREPKSEGPGSLTIGVKKLVNNGDCQISTVGFGVRTTNATITTMAPADGSWALGSVACALSVVAQVVGVDEATGAMCAYTCTVVVKWDGSSTSAVADSSGSSVSSRPFVVIRDDIGVAAVPVLAADTGILRIRVTGKASTNIKWCGRVDACAVRV